MKKLNKEQSTERARLTALLAERAEKVREAVNTFNEAQADAFLAVQEAQGEYNEIASEARGWMEDVHATMERYSSERTEKWQEGEAGQAYQTWMDGWEDAPEDIDIEEPTPLDEPTLDGEEKFDALTSDVGDV